MAKETATDQQARMLSERRNESARTGDVLADVKLTDREREVFASLTDQWLRPMDIGGRDSSYHSRVLASLVRKGLVERKGYRSYRYRNPKYVKPKPVLTRFDKAIRFTRILASYDCAGIDQDTEVVTRCGKCGPCEADQFIKSLPLGFWLTFERGEQ